MRIYLPFFRYFLFSLLLLAVMAGCRKKTAETVANSAVKPGIKKITITDDLDRELQIPAQPKRILALAPSMTEMLFAVCPDSVIVGRTQNCNYPEAAKKKPVVNNFPLDLEGLLALRPDLIFTEEGITSMETAEKIQTLGIPVYFQKYRKVEDVFRGLNDIGRIMRRETEATQLTDSLKAELNAIEKEAKSKKPMRALVLISSDPIYVYGRNTLMTDKLLKAGGDNALQEVFSQISPALTREYVLKLNPDVIFGQNREQMERTFFKLYPELKQVNAYRNQRLYQLNDDLASRPSPRIVESVREIKKYLNQ
jgi:iron complex transport system substrate-binding protein